jgi:hypothetical protein
MRLKMIAFVGASLFLMAGCDGKSPLAQADSSCVQKPVCAAPGQPAAPAAAPATPPSYAPTPRPRRAVRYRYSRRSGSYASTGSYGSGDYRYEGEVKDYSQVYSSGDTRYAGTRVQIQSTDSYASSSQSETTYSGYAGGYVAGSGYAGGTVYVSGAPGGCPGACGRVRAAGRDRNGYLTWPSK